MTMAGTKQTDWFTENDLYLFGEGTNYKIYEKLGAHETETSLFAIADWLEHALKK